MLDTAPASHLGGSIVKQDVKEITKPSLAYQLARAASGGLAALFLGKGLDISVEGGYGVGIYMVFFGIGGLFVLLTIWLSWVIHFQKQEGSAANPQTRPLTWGDLKNMRVPVESSFQTNEERPASRCARHIHAELEANHQRIDAAIKNGFWWNVTLEGLQSREWQQGKDLMAGMAPMTYDAVAPVYVLIDAMNVQAGNHLQGGHDEFGDETASELRSLRGRIKTAQRALQKYYREN